ncbi:MAG TPA: SMC-Scp complex subunit ScpB [Pseudomonadales bacterium]|nr:SMC-Scp complex subunit ScpB [Pseudomonadales bacterium]
MEQVDQNDMSEFTALKQIIEAAIMAADGPLAIDNMISLFEGEQPTRAQVRDALTEIEQDCEGRGFELKQVASGYRFQVREDYGQWIGRLWEERPPRYTRALLETLALIAYKQPITRGDIEEIRGVAVSTNIIRTLLEREWIRIVGHRDVPGRPAIYATTKAFLDYFNLSSLDELPTLSEIKDLDKLNPELELEEELIEPRSLDITSEEAAEMEAAEDANLEEVTERVNTIQENIKTLFAGEEEDEDDLEDDWDDESGASGEVTSDEAAQSAGDLASEESVGDEVQTVEDASDDSESQDGVEPDR